MSEETELIELPDNVIEDLQEREREQQRLYQELLQKQDEFEDQAESNREYMQAIADLKGIEDIENYRITDDGLKRLPDEQIQSTPDVDVETEESFKNESTDFDMDEAIGKIEALDTVAAKQFISEDEDRPQVLQALVNKDE